MKKNLHYDPRIGFFNQIASDWDSWHDLADLESNLSAIFDKFAIFPDETIVDVGCGTGNLTTSLLPRLGERGKIIALDISPEMLKLARAKCSDSRVAWFLSTADHIPAEDNTCDRVICFSAWPHFERAISVIQEIRRVLKPDGHCHILHVISRESVNSIHREAHPSVTMDTLLPVVQVAEQFKSECFMVEEAIDNADRYLLSVRKQENPL